MGGQGVYDQVDVLSTQQCTAVDDGLATELALRSSAALSQQIGNDDDAKPGRLLRQPAGMDPVAAAAETEDCNTDRITFGHGFPPRRAVFFDLARCGMNAKGNPI
jgi:hypothetical protein